MHQTAFPHLVHLNADRKYDSWSTLSEHTLGALSSTLKAHLEHTLGAHSRSTLGAHSETLLWQRYKFSSNLVEHASHLLSISCSLKSLSKFLHIQHAQYSCSVSMLHIHQNWLKHLSGEEEKVWIDQIPRWNLENRSKSRMGTGLPSIEASTTTSLTCHTNSFVCATKRFLFFFNSNLRAISGGHFLRLDLFLRISQTWRRLTRGWGLGDRALD